MKSITYEELRRIAQNGDGLFFQAGSWSSYLIRWWTNDEEHWFKRWFSLAPYQHAEIVVWDAVIWGSRSQWSIKRLSSNLRLCAWGSVDGGPRKTPLKRLVQSYNTSGGKVFWAPLGPSVERGEIIRRANEQWGAHYPNLRQWLRSALRNWFKGCTDTDPNGTTCWEFVARCYGLEEPTSWYGKEIAFEVFNGDVREIIV